MKDRRASFTFDFIYLTVVPCCHLEMRIKNDNQFKKYFTSMNMNQLYSIYRPF